MRCLCQRIKVEKKYNIDNYILSCSAPLLKVALSSGPFTINSCYNIPTGVMT